MRLLELIQPYPFFERAIYDHWASDDEIAEAHRHVRHIAGPSEYARLMAETPGDNGLSNAFHDQLDSNGAYIAAQKAAPFLKDSPAVYRYRNKYGTHEDDAVIAEIHACGLWMPAGQTLFHGGQWPAGPTLPATGSVCETKKPLSTSLCAQVAAVHSLSPPPGFLWQLVLSDATPCFVFNSKNRLLGHEYEVLLPPLELTCTGVETAGLQIPIIHVAARYIPVL